jgi:REP element-mobilizing transposase RayT
MTEVVVNLVDHEEPRRPPFNYTGIYRYLITLPVFRGKEVFTDRERVLAVLNALRDSALNFHFDVYAYCFLPAEMILVVRGKDRTANMKEFLRAFRKLSAEALEPRLGHPLWKKKYLERVLRRDEDTKHIVSSVFQRPVTMGLAQKTTDYPFQGSFVLVPRRGQRR